MKKKGFTLIELLAVIVILAIIALIATPLVLKYIEKSRKESKVDSAYSFVRNLETEIANYSIKNNGKKYNGQPTDKGYYELDSFNSADIDTTVKGDKPNSIKVCLSSLGQVEKAMFEYRKYYVSYDGKKGSISDKDTYDNFSCSGSSQSDYLFNEDVEFIKYDDTVVGLYTFENVQIPNFELGKFYGVTINNEEEIITRNEGGLIDENKNAIVYFYDDQLITYSSSDLTGKINVKIRELEIDNKWFRVHSDGCWYIYSSDFAVGFSAGLADIKIQDNEGNIYFEVSGIEFIEDNGSDVGLIGTDYSNYNNGATKLQDLYNAVASGKTITITVTQIIDGETIISTIGGGEPILFEGNKYYWGIPHCKGDVM